MTLATHAVTGALIGAVASHNIALAASAAFLSHFIFDTIPHWDYSLGALEQDNKNPLNNRMKTKGLPFFIDLSKIGFDFLIGIGLTIAAFYTLSPIIFIGALIGALCAVIPDPLQFVYWKFRFVWLKPLQSFHLFMHAKTRLNDRPILGILSQTAIIALILLLIQLIFT